METPVLVLLGSLISAMILFFCSLCYSISGNTKRGTKFVALGLLNLAISCVILLYCGGSQMSLGQTRNVKIAALIFIGLSALFYWAGQLAQKNNDSKEK